MPPTEKQTIITLHCICGLSMVLTFPPTLPPETIQRQARAAFEVDHSGAGHGLCDERTAARRRAGWQRRMFDDPTD